MGSTWDLPDGVSTDQIDAYYSEPRTCLDCAHFVASRFDDTGICGLRFRDAYDLRRTKDFMTPWEAARWGAGWAVDNAVGDSEQACGRFS